VIERNFSRAANADIHDVDVAAELDQSLPHLFADERETFSSMTVCDTPDVVSLATTVTTFPSAVGFETEPWPAPPMSRW